MKRRRSRENAVLALFELSFGINSLSDIIETSREMGEYEIDEYGESLLNFFIDHSSEIDMEIKDRLKDWTIDRLPRVNAAILRIAVAEIMLNKGEMDSIVINEAVEISKTYSGDTDYQFINGVLGSFVKDYNSKKEV